MKGAMKDYSNQYIKTLKNAIRKAKKLLTRQPKNRQLEEKIKRLEGLPSGERIKKRSKKRHKI